MRLKALKTEPRETAQASLRHREQSDGLSNGGVGNAARRGKLEEKKWRVDDSNGGTAVSKSAISIHGQFME